MPITITPVSPTGNIGLGLTLRISSDFIGPLPGDAVFNIFACVDSEGLQRVWSETRTANNQHEIDHTFGRIDNPGPVIPGQFKLSDGATSHIIVTLTSGATTIDTGAQAIPWTNEEGLGTQAFLNSQVINNKPTGGGLTQPQAQALAQANLASQLAISGPAIGQFVANVANAFSNPGLFFVCPVAGPTSVSGTGTLVPITTTLPSVLVGLMWHFGVVPPGVGRSNGFITQYAQRALQLVGRYQLAHNLGPVINGEITDWNVDDTPWFFQRLFPSVIGYSVTPGFAVDFTWLVASPTC